MKYVYTAAFLLTIAESANVPRVNNDPWPWHTYSNPDGWQVVVFFDAGDLDYIDHFIAPDGTKIGVWGHDEQFDHAALRAWPEQSA